MSFEQELTLAKLDIGSILNNKPIKFDTDLIVQASKLISKSELKVKELLNFSDIKTGIPKNSISVKEFDKITENLKQLTPEDLENKISKISNDEVRRAIALALPMVISQLLEMIPVNSSVTLTGLDIRPPSDREKFKFIQKVRVLENPFVIFELMEYGLLNKTETDALKLFYPTLYQVWAQLIIEYIGGHKKQLSNRQNQQLSVFLEIPRLNPQTMLRLQEQYKKEGNAVKTPQGDTMAQNLSGIQQVQER